MSRSDKQEIDKYKTSNYEHLAIFKKSCQYCNIVSQLVLGINSVRNIILGT